MMDFRQFRFQRMLNLFCCHKTLGLHAIGGKFAIQFGQRTFDVLFVALQQMQIVRFLLQYFIELV